MCGKKPFNRKKKTNTCGVLIGLLALDLALIIIWVIVHFGGEVSNNAKVSLGVILGMFGTLLIILALVGKFTLEDFDYSIEVYDQKLLFCWSDGEKTPVQKPFSTNIGKNTICIYDENGAVVKVPYDKGVTKYLKMVNVRKEVVVVKVVDNDSVVLEVS